LSVPAAFHDETAPPPVSSVLESVDKALLLHPQTPFIALHSALALAASGDVELLVALREHCDRATDATMRTVGAPVCDALVAVAETRWDDAADLLTGIMPVLARVGGSAAQREVVEETLLFCLVESARADQAATLLDARLHRRPSPLDRRRLSAMTTSRRKVDITR